MTKGRYPIGNVLAILLTFGVGLPAAPAPESSPAKAPEIASSSALAAKTCRASGGRLQRVCSLRYEMCIIRYRDGGNTCQDSSDCTGGCYFDFDEYCRNKGVHCFDHGPPQIGDKVTGHCRVDNYPCGNFWKIDGGRVVDTVNVD